MRLLHRTGSALLGFGLLGTPAVAADYHVGPGQALATLGAVPWSTLKAGDTVFVHYQATPYHEKMCISGQGTATSPIRISGVPGPNGEVPVISGANATTSPNCDFHWQDAAGGSAVQWYGVVFVMFAENAASPANKLPPAYIEIANLHIQDGTGSFTTEAGAAATYDPFTACIYARSPQHLTVQNVEMSNCGLGFFNWTGGVDNVNWWEAVAKDITLRNNYFHDNGVVGQFTQHQSYTEALGALIEGNRYGPVRTGMNGSQLKDRSSGSVIRYNSIEAPPNGWVLDLVEPQEAAPVLLADPAFKQTFVYGNLLFASNGRAPDLVHWNEDHQLRQGRADDPASRLFFYNNTIAVTGITGSPLTQYIFNTTYGAFDCDPVAPQGRIDVRNNIVYFAASSGTVPEVRWSYCQDVNIDFATNLVLPVPTTVTHAPGSVVVTGQSNLLSGNPAFVSATDLHVQVASSAAGKGGALAAGVPAVMMPASQYVYDSKIAPRPSMADLGAFSSGAGPAPTPDPPPPDPTPTPTPTPTPGPTPTPSAVVNPTSIEFLCPDHAQDDQHELDFVRISDNTVVKTVLLGDPPAGPDGIVRVTIDVTSLPFGEYVTRLRILGNGISSATSPNSNPFQRAPLTPPAPVVK